jgi:multicomponent Na+:H+ antiporter subunit G
VSLIADVATMLLVVAGGVFFLAGTVGLIRFPDFFTRLHAMTKADNVGLGLVVLGLAVQAQSWMILGQLFVVWFLVLLGSASSAHLLAQSALRCGLAPWRAPGKRG